MDFTFRDNIIKKIENKEELTEREIGTIEIALTTYLVENMILDEHLGITKEENNFKLRHKY